MLTPRLNAVNAPVGDTNSLGVMPSLGPNRTKSPLPGSTRQVLQHHRRQTKLRSGMQMAISDGIEPPNRGLAECNQSAILSRSPPNAVSAALRQDIGQFRCRRRRHMQYIPIKYTLFLLPHVMLLQYYVIQS